jgi:hypothetical protein
MPRRKSIWNDSLERTTDLLVAKRVCDLHCAVLRQLLLNNCQSSTALQRLAPKEGR